MREPIRTLAQAENADATDPLAFTRERFTLREGLTYLDGNSLGAMAKHLPDVMADAVSRQWGNDLIDSWNNNGWWSIPNRIGERIGALAGAAPGQVVCGDSTTIQLYQALTAMTRLAARVSGRRTIITDGANFPTDQYVAESVARSAGMTLLRVNPAHLADVLDDSVAVVSLSAVDYRTGELWDTDAITRAVHGRGAYMLWDVCHAIGAVPVELDAWNADAAVGCTYKYLNGGPGSPAWIYLPHRMQEQVDLPLTGWHGHADPFGFSPTYEPALGITRARIGAPPVLAMIALEAALDVWNGVDMKLVRGKSLALTDLVIGYADEHLADFGVEPVTPREHARRGSQVSLRMPFGYEVSQALIARGVVGDFRAPDMLRFGFTPLYLSYAAVWRAMDQLRDILATRAYEASAFARPSEFTVT